MTNPYIRWDPSWNADMWTRSAEGPLNVAMPEAPTEAQVEKFKKLISISSTPKIYQDADVKFIQSQIPSGGTNPSNGLGVDQFQWMPEDLTFPSPGPDPFDMSVIHSGVQYRYVNLGWRMFLRGYAATISQGELTGEFRVKFFDTATRDIPNTRAAWTGLLIDVFNLDQKRTDHAVNILHGKRGADPNWLYHCGWQDRLPGGPETLSEQTTPFDDLSEIEVRMVIAGSPPLWSVTYQYKDGLNWVDIDIFNGNFQSHVAPAPLNEVGFIMSAFSGVGIDKPGSPSEPWPEQSIWFREFELSQFEPWVPDMSDWSIRQWNRHWDWLVSSPTREHFSTSEDPFINTRRPVTDLLHYPIGTENQPLELRTSDPELGICVKLGPKTTLFAKGNADNKLVEELPAAPTEPIAVCDKDLFGADAPFAFYYRGKFENMNSLSADSGIVSLGDIFNGAPTVNDNGIGLFWKYVGAGSGKFVVRYFDDGAFEDLEFDVPDVSVFSDIPIDIGFAWTGARGISAGLNNYELRLVINGITEGAVQPVAFGLASSAIAYLGATASADGCPSLFRQSAMFGDAVTNAGLREAFEGAHEPFANQSFEIASDNQRPGEAKFWEWYSYQQEVQWAEFNAYDYLLEQWKTATEEFKQGWFDLENYIDDIADFIVVAAIFNADAPVYRSTMEEFGIWDGPPWKDDFIFIQPFEDTLGNFGGPTGFDSWYDGVHGTNFMPLEKDVFGEAWKNDPFSTSFAALWYGGRAHYGRMIGNAVKFPINISTDKRNLVMYSDAFGIVELALNIGTYSNAADLVDMLNVNWEAFGTSGMNFDYIEKEDETFLSFGWDSNFYSAGASMFGARATEPSNDVRELLGFDKLGPNQVETKMHSKLWMLGSIIGIDPEEIFYLDSWSFLEYAIVTEPDFSDGYVLDYGMEPAIFNVGLGYLQELKVEGFEIKGWFGSTAVWRTTDYGSGDVTAALFDLGTVDMEEFDPAEWPEQIWT